MSARIRRLVEDRSPLTVGSAVVNRASTTSTATAWVELANPAPHSGVIKSVDVYADTNGPITIMTGTLVSGTFSVEAVATVSLGTGLETFAVNLPIPSGGLIGFWSGNTDGALSWVTSGGGGIYLKATTTQPTAGTPINGMSLDSGGVISIQGTGS